MARDWFSLAALATEYRDASGRRLDPPKRPFRAARWSPPAGRASARSSPTPAPRTAGSAPARGSRPRRRRAPCRRSRGSPGSTAGHGRDEPPPPPPPMPRGPARWPAAPRRPAPCTPPAHAAPPRRPRHGRSWRRRRLRLEPAVGDLPDRRAALPCRQRGTPGSAVVTMTCPRSARSSERRSGAARVELAEHVVEEDDRARAVGAEQVGLGELHGEDDRPLLPAAGVRGHVPTAELRHAGRRAAGRRGSPRSTPPSAAPRRSVADTPPSARRSAGRRCAGRGHAPARRPSGRRGRRAPRSRHAPRAPRPRHAAGRCAHEGRRAPRAGRA